MDDLILIDGSRGEGGGQILRTSLALALVTGKPFRISRIRAGRTKPGLMRQHLTAVRAAAEIGAAEVEGDAIGSLELVFTPRRVRPGEYRFAVGTAGSATLVLQTILPALILADGPSVLTLEGGTHNPWAPPFDFLAKAFLPLLGRMGPRVEAELVRPGFYPAGGGSFVVSVQPAARLEPLELVERGPILRRSARARVAGLPRGIAERELKALGKALSWGREQLEIEELDRGAGPGNVLTLELESAALCEVVTGFGEKGVTAEQVADAVAREARELLASDAPVGRHLADQLVLPLALAGAGRFRTLPPTRHTTTNIEVTRAFLPVAIDVREGEGRTWEISFGGPR